MTLPYMGVVVNETITYNLNCKERKKRACLAADSCVCMGISG